MWAEVSVVLHSCWLCLLPATCISLSEMENEGVQELSWDLGSGTAHPKIRRIVPVVLEMY